MEIAIIIKDVILILLGFTFGRWIVKKYWWKNN